MISLNNFSMIQLALEMLNTTNPYPKAVHEFYYSYVQAKHREYISFENILKRKLQGKKRSVRSEGALEKDYSVCYSAIRDTMIEYFENYKPQSFAFQQETKSRFAKWLKMMEKKYGIPEEKLPRELDVNRNDQDTAIVMLKELHDRNGKTVRDIAEKMNISARAVQKDLKKLDPRLNQESEETELMPAFRIGGQPIHTNISVKKPYEGNINRYYTVNTVHPLVLLENQMQIGTLLQALAHSYNAGNETSYSIGLDIWYQLSAYSKERVKAYFVYNDDVFESFIKQIENEVPDSKGEKFQTEKSMFMNLGMAEDELITYAMKGQGRRCNIVLKEKREELVAQLLSYYTNDKGEIIYRATGLNGEINDFRREQLENIEIEI